MNTIETINIKIKIAKLHFELMVAQITNNGFLIEQIESEINELEEKLGDLQ